MPGKVHHFWFLPAFAAALAALSGCGGGSSASVPPAIQGPPAPPPGPPPPPSPPPPNPGQFVSVTASSGISFVAGFDFGISPPDVAAIVPSAVASGDYDDDGDIDLFIVRGDRGPNLLYRNDGNMIFEDVAEFAGVANTRSPTRNYRHAGPMFVDLDGDRDLDLYVGGINGDPSRVFANNGDGTFTDVTSGSGIDGMQSEHNLSAAFGDYDLDGDPDMFIAHWGSSRDFANPGDTEHLWRNDSDATGIRFTSVSEAAGISPSILALPDDNITQGQLWDFTFAPTFARINDDYFPDLLSVADFNYSHYFVNNQDGTFTNATDTDVIIDGNGMGAAVADYDNDGDLDWFVTSIDCHDDSDCAGGILSKVGNRLYRNTNGTFEDVTEEAGVDAGGWGWGACFLDIENDGDLDIYHTNGWPIMDAENDFLNDTSRLFVSDGAGHFEDRAAEYGLADTEQGRGVVCADFDNDGDTDILLLHRADDVAATLWRNDLQGNNYLRVRLRGLAPNTEATGARIKIRYSGTTQMREICTGSNFASQNPTLQSFGLGGASQVDELTVEWPDGRQTVLTAIQAGQTLTIVHPEMQ